MTMRWAHLEGDGDLVKVVFPLDESTAARAGRTVDELALELCAMSASNESCQCDYALGY